MIANRVALLTIELAQSEAMGQKQRSNQQMERQRVRSQSIRWTKNSRTSR